MSRHPTIPLEFHRIPEAEMRRAGEAFLRALSTRRSVRHFAPDPVPRELVELAVRAAGTAPSGANRQPWLFVMVEDAGLKREIRAAAEAEEKANYEGGRFPERWLQALEPLGTDWEKPYLETAPWLVVAFRQDWRIDDGGEREVNYYVHESVGIACGFFIAALHAMGLATLPHTPSPMGFLSRLLRRPTGEKPYILFPVGYPAPGARVPDISRKALDEIRQRDAGAE